MSAASEGVGLVITEYAPISRDSASLYDGGKGKGFALKTEKGERMKQEEMENTLKEEEMEQDRKTD